MRLLITGCTGFVGRNLLLEALRSGKYDEILVPVRSVEKLTAQLLGDGFLAVPPNVKPFLGSDRAWNVKGLGPIDHVVHVAGSLFARSESEFRAINVRGTEALFEELVAPGRVIVLSSQAASGPCADGQQSKSEQDVDRPLTAYGRSKLAMETLLAERFSGSPYVVFRPPMVLGPRDKATLPLFKMVRSPFHFKPGRGSKYYSFTAVEDLVSAIFCALLSPLDFRSFDDRRFYICANETISDRDLIRGAAEASKRWGVVIPVPQRVVRLASDVIDRVPRWREAVPSLSKERATEIWPDRWVISSKRFQTLFGWCPSKSLASTLQDTYAWYAKTGQLKPLSLRLRRKQPVLQEPAPAN